MKVVIKAQGISEPLTCEGETIVVNRHGALISTVVALSKGLRIEVQVYLTDKRANAEVVYLDPKQPLCCGIAPGSQRTFGEYRCPRTTGTKAQRMLEIYIASEAKRARSSNRVFWVFVASELPAIRKLNPSDVRVSYHPTRARVTHVTLADLKGKDAESEEAQEHANSSSLALYV